MELNDCSNDRHLVAAADLDAVGEIATIYMLRGSVEFRHRARHAAGEPHADKERRQLNQSEENRDTEQSHTAGFSSCRPAWRTMCRKASMAG